jgi:predicted transposase/invertase (TIGR01784 family)
MKTAKNQGVKESKKEIALNFLKMGLPVNQIAEGTGLPIEEIEQLRK